MSAPIAEAAARPRFKPGDRVAVRVADPPGHIRTPWYIRGHTGVIEREKWTQGFTEAVRRKLDGPQRRPRQA